MLRTLAVLVLGVAAGVAFVVACDDKPSVPDADAAACDCPSAEPPVPGRVQRFYQTADVAGPGGSYTQTLAAYCNNSVGGPGILLGGGCYVKNNTPGIYVTGAPEGIPGNEDPGFLCQVNNTTVMSGQDQIIAVAICLMPE
jgi:hypothetical protein